MGRARGRSSGRVSISRGRSIELPDDIQPILKESDVNGSRVQGLEQQVQTLQGANQALENRNQELENRIAELEGQLQNTVSISEAQNAVQQAFNAGVQRVIQYLKQQGIL